MERFQISGPVVCVGDMTPDVVIPYGETLRALSRLEEGEVVLSNPFLRPGGAVSNTVATLGKLGLDPIMVGGVGSDEYGDYLVNYLEGCGVRTGHIFRQPERSSIVLAVLDGAGERVLYLFNGPGAKLPELGEEQVPRELIGRAGWFHTNGFANDVTVDFMEACRAAGAVVSFDLNLRCETFGLDETRKSRILRAVRASHVVFGSGAEEFLPLTGAHTLAEGAAALAGEGRVVVARDGAAPVRVFDGARTYQVPVDRVEAVNTVGGGDAFNGGFIAACALGRTVREGVLWGCRCAASAISSDQPHHVPPRAEVARWAAARMLEMDAKLG